ncbi:MAG: hypothetical protein ACI97A_001268 [Planctomycetota bacterium]|jgi:hypothetical protein
MDAKLSQLRDVRAPVPSLQVLIDEVELTTLVNGGLRVRLSVRDESLVITNSKQKRSVAAAIDISEGQRFEQHCLEMRSRKIGDVSVTQFDNFFLRHSSAGVLAFIGDQSHNRILLFERDIEPVGWNIANGGSSSLAELTDVNALLLREASEEILFLNPTKQTLHTIQGALLTDELELALALWSKRLSAQRGDDLSWVSEPGTDQLIVEDESGVPTTTSHLSLALNALDFGIECGQVMRLQGPSSLIPLDGEILNDDLLDRRVGYFSSKQEARLGQPSALFQSGTKKAASENRTTALCPVTEKMLDRLLDQSNH